MVKSILEQTTEMVVPEWLDGARLLQLRISLLSPMATLAVFWGMLSMLDTAVLTTDIPSNTTEHVKTDKPARELSASNDLDKPAKGSAGEMNNSEDADVVRGVTAKKDYGSVSVESRAFGGMWMRRQTDLQKGSASAREGVVGEGVEAAQEAGGRLVCEAVLGELFTLDERCQSTSSRVQCIKTVTLWAARIM